MIIDKLDLVAYRRVSTDDQKERGSSLEAQTAKMLAYAERLGHTLIAIVDDGGESARSLDRPGIKTCLAMLRSGEVKGLLVANLDRLTRHVGDLVELVEGDFLAANGPVLLSASEPVETRTAVGRLQIYILAVVSQYSREAGAERTAGVMRFKKTKAERTGNIRFGSKVDASDPRRSKGGLPIALVDSPEDVENGRLMLLLRRRGLTLQKIADEMNRRGIPSKRGVTRRSTGLWAKSSVHAILSREERAEAEAHAKWLAELGVRDAASEGE